MKVVLTRITGGTRLRTDSVVGECSEWPTIGQPFSMVAPGLEFGIRHVVTSPVKSVVVTGREYKPHSFTTESNSEYSLMEVT